MNRRVSVIVVVCLLLASLVNTSLAIDRNRGRKPRVKQQSSAPRGQYDTPQEARERAALDHYLRGMALESENDIFGAYAEFDTAMYIAPSSQTIRMAFVKAAAAIGRFQEARDAAGKLDTTDSESLRILSELYRQARVSDSVLYYLTLLVKVDSTDIDSRKTLASYYEQNGDLISAIPYRKDIAEITGKYQAYNELGALQYLSGLYEDAVFSFNKSIELEPDAKNIPSYSGLADALGELRDTVRQREILGKLLELDSTHVPTHRRFIDYYSRQRQFDSALIHAKIEVGLAPHDQDAIRRLGIIAYSADSLDLAEDQFNELISISNLDFTNYFFLGRIFLEKENYRYAVINFRTAIRANDSIPEGWLGLGQTYLAMDSLRQAESTYQEALTKVKEEDGRLRLLFSLGATREQLGEYELAEKAFERVLEMDSTNAPALNYLGYMLVDRNDRVPYAKGLIRRALIENPKSGAYIDSYAWALFREGAYQQAKDSLFRALELIDNDPTVFDHLGDTYEKLGMPDSAKVYWQKALEKDSSNTAIKEKLAR